MRLVSSIFLISLVAGLPAIAGGANALFVFHGNATRAEVYDPDSLHPLASIEVGMGASHAFGLADPANAGRFGKFYVVSPAAVSIFDAEFQILGEIFLEAPTSSPVAAASLAFDGRRLLIAAAKRLIVIDTGTDQIIASPEPGFVVSSIAATSDNHIVYVMSAESGYVREFDLAANAFSSHAYVLPSVGTALAVAPDGQTVYAAVPGSVFDLRTLPRLPLPGGTEGTPSLVTSLPDLTRFGGSPDAEGPYRLGAERNWIDKLLLSYGGRYVMRVGGKWFEGSLKDAAMLRPMIDPRRGLPFQQEVVDIAMVSPRQVFAAVDGEPALLRSDPADPENAREIALASAPSGLALVSPTLTQDAGSLEQVAGDGVVIAGGGSFELTVLATGPNGFPQSQVAVFASDITPAAAQCFSELTDGNGEATLYCVAEPTESMLLLEVTLSDDAGRTAPAFGINVLPAIEFEGLAIVSGDGQTVGQEGAFELVVTAAKDGLVDKGAVLDVEVELDDDAVDVTCPAQVTTDEDGMAVIACATSEFDDSQLIPEPIKATITVSNDRGSSVTFRITIDPAITSVDTGLFKVSGNNQIVQQGRVFPLPLVVRSLIDGELQVMEQLAISTDPKEVTCPIFALTNEEGLASIQCRADTVTREIQGKILFAGPKLRSALFDARITFFGAGLAVDVEFVTASPFEGKTGKRLVDAVTARALGSSGQGVAGAEVFFFSENDVTFDPPSAISDIRGDATTTVILGCNRRGEGELMAGLADGVEMDKLNFESEAGELAGLFKVQGDNQSGSPGQRLSRALFIRTGDVCENGIRRVPLTWHVLPEPRATLSNVFQQSNDFGDASAVVSMGAYGGPFQIAVESGRFRAVFDLNTTLDPTSLVRLSGDQQSVMAEQYAAQPLVVEVRGTNGFGVSGVDVDFEVTQGSATLTETSVKSDGLGVAFTRLRATGEGAILVTASAIGQSVTFNLGTGVVGPIVPVEGFVNGASFVQGWTPGSLGSLFLSGLLGDVDGVVLPQDFPFPTTLEGVQIKVNGVPAPLIAVININGAEQINLQVPFGPGSGPATVMVERDGLSTTVEGVPLTAVQPGIFEFGLDGQLFAAILDAPPDNKLVTPSNPAVPGKVVQLFLTGLGPTNPMVGTNQPGPVPLGLPLADVSVGIDDQGVEVLGSFYAPDAITLYQINFRIPGNAQAGNRKLSVVADGVASQDSLIPIQ